MDRHPLTTGNQCLTNALNATFITKNGNELMLQNDMGNTMILDSVTGAVMQLSPGFVPVGMKELGGILYIVSANKEGKSEIGTIPSPIITWDYIDISKLDTSSILANDSLDYDVKIISKELYSGEQFLVTLNLDCGSNILWDEVNNLYTCELPDYDPIKTLEQGLLILSEEIHPFITTVDKKGFYTIDLYSCNALQKRIIPSNKLQQFYLAGDPLLYSSNYWFIPLKMIEGHKINLQYTRLAQKLLKFSTDYNSGKLGIKTSIENISDFRLVKRAGGMVESQGPSYLPYTIKTVYGYYTYFSSFSYKSDSSVRVAKLNIKVINNSTNQSIKTWVNKTPSSIPNEITCDTLTWDEGKLKNTELIDVISVLEYSKNISYNILPLEEDNILFSTFNYGNNTFYIQKKVLDSKEFKSGTNTHTSKESANDREGLFYIKYNTKDEYNSWYTLTVDYYDQIDRKLGTYTLKFNPFYNDYIGDGVDLIKSGEAKTLNNITKFLNTNYKVETLFEGLCKDKAKPSLSITADFTKLEKIKLSYLNSDSCIGKFSAGTVLSSIEAYVPLAARYDWTNNNDFKYVNILISIKPNDKNFSEEYTTPKNESQYIFECFDSKIPAGVVNEIKIYGLEAVKKYDKYKACTLTKTRKNDNKFSGIIPVIQAEKKDNKNVILFGQESSTFIFSKDFKLTTSQTSDSIIFNISATASQTNFQGVFVGSDIEKLDVTERDKLNAALLRYVYTPKPLSIVGKIKNGIASVLYNLSNSKSFKSLITQFSHYYNYTDKDTAEEKAILGNIGGNLPIKTNLVCVDGKPQNLATITGNSFKSSVFTGKYRIDAPYHSVLLDLYGIEASGSRSITGYNNESTISVLDLPSGIYVMNFYGYRILNKSKKTDKPSRSKLYFDINFSNSEITERHEITSGKPILINAEVGAKITVITDKFPNDGDTIAILSFGVYKVDAFNIVDFSYNSKSNTVVTVEEFNKKFKNNAEGYKSMIVMPLAETYREKVTCLNVDFDYTYCPEEAYYTYIDLDGNECHYALKENTSEATPIDGAAYHIPENTKIR